MLRRYLRQNVALIVLVYRIRRRKKNCCHHRVILFEPKSKTKSQTKAIKLRLHSWCTSLCFCCCCCFGCPVPFVTEYKLSLPVLIWELLNLPHPENLMEIQKSNRHQLYTEIFEHFLHTHIYDFVSPYPFCISINVVRRLWFLSSSFGIKVWWEFSKIP